VKRDTVSGRFGEEKADLGELVNRGETTLGRYRYDFHRHRKQEDSLAKSKAKHMAEKDHEGKKELVSPKIRGRT